MKKIFLFALLLAIAPTAWADVDYTPTQMEGTQTEGPWTYDAVSNAYCKNTTDMWSVAFNDLDHTAWNTWLKTGTHTFQWNNDNNGIGFQTCCESRVNSRYGIMSTYYRSEVVPPYTCVRLTWNYMVHGYADTYPQNVALYARDNMEELKATAVDFTVDLSNHAGSDFLLANSAISSADAWGAESSTGTLTGTFDFDNRNGSDTQTKTWALLLNFLVNNPTDKSNWDVYPQYPCTQWGGFKNESYSWDTLYYKHITFNANGGQGTMDVQQIENSDNLTANAFTRSGYTFAGWATSADGEVVYADGAEITATETDKGLVSLFAKWNIVDYTIAYDLAEGEVEPANPTQYTVATETFTLNNPTRVGYTFAGWTGTNGDEPQTEVSIAQGSTGDKTFTAHWTPITYTIAYELNEGTATNPTEYNIETATFSLNNPTRVGYTFAGWTGSNGDEPQTEVAIAQGSTGDKTFTAHWTPITYTIAYELNEGTATNPTEYNIETATFSLNNPTREGYTFTGWTGSNGETPQTEVSVVQGSIGDKSFTAHWTPITYTIAYELNEGSATNPTEYNIETATFTLANPTRVGYTFAGWTGSNGDEPQTEVAIAQGSTGDKNFTANWTINQYTITFDCDGGSDIDPIEQDYGSAITPPADPTREGYVFKGWVPAIPATMPSENMTVVAQWDAIRYRNYTPDNATVVWHDAMATSHAWFMYAMANVQLASKTDPDRNDAAGAYTWEQMDAGNSKVWVGSEWISFTSGSCSVTVNGDDVVVAGMFVGTDDKTYSITISRYDISPAGNCSVYYVGKDDEPLKDEAIILNAPTAPVITGFTFLKWVIVAGDLENGITIQAVYQADQPTSAPDVYINPADPAQKLIRDGNVYVLRDGKMYTITGARVH